MKGGKIVVSALVMLLVLGLLGCAGAGGSGGTSQAADASSSSAGGATEGQAAQEPEEKRDDGPIYPWVVARRTNTSSSGYVSEYAYEYDEAGRLATITGQQEEIVGYNERGVVQVALSYDDDGRLAGINAPTTVYLAGDVSIGYDADGRAASVVREWIVPGRMPANVGANAYSTDYYYGPDGELTSSQSTHTVEGAAIASESREYSASAGAEYDGEATSDGTPPYVGWSDDRIMAGNGLGAGAVGEFDTHGNLVKVTAGDGTVVSYEYKQIEAESGEWEPGPLSNPTLRTFAWDGLTAANYLVFFPPQLDSADRTRVLGADTIDIEPAAATEAEAADEDPAAIPSSASGLDTPYYAINLPESYGDVQLDYDGVLTDAGGGLWIGYETEATQGGQRLFEVACYSGNWGPEGWYGKVNLGTTSLEGLDVYVMVPWADPSDQAAAKARAEEYAQYVTVL